MIIMENKTEQYFLAALPEFSADFYKKIENLFGLKCYPEFRLPFHVTICFLGQINQAQKARVIAWMNEKKTIPMMSAKVKRIGFFKKDFPFVYFLELDSPELVQLNKELGIFSDIHKDAFSFIPHLSLFFPKFELSPEDKDLLFETFADVALIDFKNIYLGSNLEEVTKMHNLIPCTKL
jgi:2'-5' RNA ligase